MADIGAFAAAQRLLDLRPVLMILKRIFALIRIVEDLAVLTDQCHARAGPGLVQPAQIRFAGNIDRGADVDGLLPDIFLCDLSDFSVHE